ncbi:MAG: Alanine-tRNA ligase [Candidatus Uhrbacteria bacterium GW2011_GWF2_41_16]|uniref:Alanine--tRNA ligase n=2 Tax=Candidatus Uhriibacteriota TaxID=1752732 RepID=A0A0G0V854_9BACT|nr:MAG: Alanine-tRNA ligase [Candidatus Uhrbacteria bacterium GW2011_GWA2_41_10]KKR86081.1 MAG: Alanine-tRNA ligase [Candidatus Uhrbacteria bacterium GW2011_GWC2_41_11]KKR97213.1 MAG: Alanine-tRNA ligase [Candidatus Uhrbacteria bacterium GW2011_GWF2_41_16]
MMKTNEIRKAYLDFFQEHGHIVIPSASLIPENDPTTLFTGSGMQPMVPYLLGEAHPEGTRIVDSQKCFRSGDIEEVGDNRHTTFFEMLGNWSLGDYFKKEQITWMFEFLIKKLGLDPHRLYITAFAGNKMIKIPKDEETQQLWMEAFASVGMNTKDRITFYDEQKNWWSRFGTSEQMPVGEPGGPDSEMFWDFGAHRMFHEHSMFASQPCHVNCDCGRFLEIGNNVFMQYRKTDHGFELLPKKNVDFGGGLERFAAAVNDEPDIFRLDLFDNARLAIESITGKKYGADEKETYAFRVILDHLRAATFLICDGILPSNKDQGYFVRRLIRRAIRFAHKLGVRNAFCGSIVSAYIETYQEAYPDLVVHREMIMAEIGKEETKFKTSLEKGLREFEKIFTSNRFVSGSDAFNLYQTYGFPWELTEELVREKGERVDRQVFEDEFKKHQDLSRAGSEQKFTGGLADHSKETTRLHTATHLLNQALRIVLGDHVYQRGSNITAERLRFDFSHGEKMTQEQLQKVEIWVNDVIAKNLPIHYEMMTFEEAKSVGAIGVFEDKYASLGNKVKVYFVGDEACEYLSQEVCGGPHADHTGELGFFKILKEEAVSAGVRRIKATITEREK